MGIVKVLKNTFAPTITKIHRAALSINESKRRNEWRTVAMKEYKSGKFVIEIKDKDAVLIHSETVKTRVQAVKMFNDFQLNVFTKIVTKIM